MKIYNCILKFFDEDDMMDCLDGIRHIIDNLSYIDDTMISFDCDSEDINSILYGNLVFDTYRVNYYYGSRYNIPVYMKKDNNGNILVEKHSDGFEEINQYNRNGKLISSKTTYSNGIKEFENYSDD